MYALLWLCVLALAWFSLVLQQSGGRVVVYTLWIIVSVAGFLTHYFFLFAWIAMVAFLLIRPGQFQRRHLAVCILLTALAILPWYAIIPQSSGRWRVTQGWLKLTPQEFNRWRADRNCFLQFYSARGLELWRFNRTSSLTVLALFTLVAVVALWRSRLRLFNERNVFLVLWFAAVCAGPITIDFIQGTYLVAKPRYAIAALPAAYLLAGVGFAYLRRYLQLVVLLLIMIAWAPNVLSVYRTRSPWLPLRETARVAQAHSRPSDVILVRSVPSGVLAVARYSDGKAAMASWVAQLGTRRVPESLEQLAAGRTRILFVKIHDLGQPAPEEDWLRANATVLQEELVGNGEVVEFGLKAAAH